MRSDQKRIFGDYGTKVMYTCAGVEVSRRSRMVFESAPFMEKLPRNHWRVFVGVYMQAMITRLVGWKRKLVSVAISC